MNNPILNPPQHDSRIIGFDLLRILSMLMVIVLHLLGQGGILSETVEGSPHYYMAWGLECICYCAVDCYGLLSGYLSVGRHRYTHSKIVSLWLEVVIYSTGYACIFRIISPEYAGKRELLNALFPVLRRQYWYFTAFFGLSLFMPILHEGSRYLSKKSARLMLLLLLAVFCIFPTLFCTDPFHFRGGYSTLWLIVLYFFGALLNKSGLIKKLAPGCLAAVFFLCTALTFLLSVVSPVSIPRIGTVTLLNYTSPTVLLSAASLLLMLRELKISRKSVQRMLVRLSGASFAVYILHTNALVWKYWFYPGVLKGFAHLPVLILPCFAVGCSALVYALCFGIDSLRALFFKKVRIHARLEALENRIILKIGSAKE